MPSSLWDWGSFQSLSLCCSREYNCPAGSKRACEVVAGSKEGMLMSHRLNLLPARRKPLLLLCNAHSLCLDLWVSLTTDCLGWQASSSQARQAPAEPAAGQTSAFLCLCLNMWPSILQSAFRLWITWVWLENGGSQALTEYGRNIMIFLRMI